MATTVRITEETHAKLKSLAERAGESIPALLEKVVEAYRRQRLLDDANRGYAALRSDPASWRAELQEREVWEATLLDGVLR